MKQVESLAFKIGKAQNELRDEQGKYREATKREKIAQIWQMTKKEALKLSFAVVVTEALLVVALHFGLKLGLCEILQPKTIIIYTAKPAEAEEIKQEEAKQERKTDKEILQIIHNHESSNGTAKQGLNITCKAKGMSNEYGYNVPTCYKDNATVENIVLDWIKRHKIEGMTDEDLLSHYSNGAYTK